MSKLALLWDESYLWGIMAYKCLKKIGISFDIVTADELTDTLRDDYKILIVPGGWASNKKEALGEVGTNTIREFVYQGGSYIGFCGGAGLATSEGIGLLDVKRMPSSQRVPSLSGKIKARLTNHEIYKGIDEPIFHIWWPSQFLIDSPELRIIASYEETLDDAFSSDLKISAVKKYGDWEYLESLYGINLNPDRVIGSPLVIEGKYGKGSIILSLIHFDTFDDKNGQRVLKNLIDYLGNGKIDDRVDEIDSQDTSVNHSYNKYIEEIHNSTKELIDFGIKNFLWFWRNEMLLQWRRGIRGLECCNLYILGLELYNLSTRLSVCQKDNLLKPLKDLRDKLIPYIEALKELLFLERLELQKGHLTYIKTENYHIEAKRMALFSSSKSYGGVYKNILNSFDKLLLLVLKSTKIRASLKSKSIITV
ncbi:MAG TPA: hypothetical protein HPP56_02445 [Nitrospirae bacterium]|nr:hypothetical protein [Nitrospirota bacterium]